MKVSLKQVGKVVALWVALVFGTILSGIIVHPVPHPGVVDGPLPVLSAMLVVTGADALILAFLASRLVASRIAKAAILFLVFFALETGLSWIEATAFRHTLGLSSTELSAILAGGACRALVAATAAALLWPAASGARQPVVLAVDRIVAAIAAYVLLYFAAGYLIAWQSGAVRTFYHDGLTIDTRYLALLQIGRGALWTGLAALIASRTNARLSTMAWFAALAFAVLMVAPLLYPSAIMPWAVRRVHLIELAVSNGLFGVLSMLLFRYRPIGSSAPNRTAPA